MKNTKRFHKGDLVGAYMGSHSEVYGIIIEDDVFNDGFNADQYVKVRWTNGEITTSNTLGMAKVREQ